MKGVDMNNDKSSIDSFNISLGASASKAPVPADRQGQPWSILLCSDFGFRSVSPLQIRIAQWNEFMASANIVISGTIDNFLSPSAPPVFVEYHVSSMKDFSIEVMKTKISPFSGYANLLDSLAGFLDGKTSREEVLLSLQKAALPPQENTRLRNMLGNNAEAHRTLSDTPRRKSAINSILSMVDIADDTQAPPPHTAIDGLLTTISDPNGQIADKPGCLAYIEAGNKLLEAQLAALLPQPFFAVIKASWQSLFLCAKAIGRKKEINLNVFSAPMDTRDEALEKLTSLYSSSDSSPDIIVWDYPTLFTNADIDRLTKILEDADRFKSVVIAPLSSQDKLFNTIDQSNDFSPMFEDIRFLPFKKLRMTLASRALCLCAPDMKVPDNNHANDMPQVSSHCCWPVILRWIEMVIGNSDPFAVDLYDASAETALSDPLSYAYAISESFSHDAAMTAGLTFFTGKPFNATLSRAATVIEPEAAGTAYTSLAFNLLVNRAARLVGLRIMQNTSSTDKYTIAQDIESFLGKELIACRACTAQDQVTVKVDDEGKLDISLNSDVLVGGHPARFSFSLEI
jgi:hypothetical protein